MQDFPSQGPIDGLFLPRLVASLHLDEFEGALRLTFPDATKILYFKRGEIASAASNAEPDRLANILIQEGRLGAEQLDLARNSIPPGASLGKTLIDMGFLSPSELLQGARRQVRLIVVSCFRSTSGGYEMVPGPLPPEVTSLGLNTRRLVFDCLQEAGDRAAVIREIGSMESVYRPTDRLALALSGLKLDAETDRVARLLDGTSTLRDLSSRTALDDFTVGKIVLALDLLRAAERVAPAAGEVAARPAPAIAVAAAEPATRAGGRGRTIPVETDPEEEPPEPAPVESADATDDGEVVIIEEDAGGDAAPPGLEPAPAPPRPSEPPRAAAATPAEPTPFPAEELPAFASPLPGESATVEPQWQVDPETGERVHVGPIEMTFDGKVGGRHGETRGLSRFMTAAVGVAVVAAATIAFLILRRGTSAPEPPGEAAEAGTIASAPPPAAPPDAQPPATPPAEPERPARDDSATAPVPETVAAAPSAPPTPRPRPARAGAAVADDPGYARARQRLDQDDAAGAAGLFREVLSARRPGAVSLQLMIACQEDTVKGARRRAGEGSELYILPYTLKGRSCYRVLWGLYESAEDARAAVPTLPAGLSEGTHPITVSVARLLPAE
ncbi:MAG TPA: DUF4388 domain-containing protein [Candidatus Polarisedimenticolia bacterium]|jgi:hypothetical protein|nr:DUF4388 domain-containing protein [Candidatus Polarisedimenticolia bacterium]